jgi:DNA (cytosine-5)-methyltransferase 1
MNGLDLFSGIGGISIALEPWVRTVAYCERDTYAQGVLLSRMRSGEIDTAPIWDDVTTLRGDMLPKIDIISGGFPCQDLSIANTNGKGLEGKRSGLFFEIIRLARECNPRFIFLENVPAIRTRGGEIVVKELASLGYDCRWTTLSASAVGAPHKRDRWFLVAHSKCARLGEGTDELGDGSEWRSPDQLGDADSSSGTMADPISEGLRGGLSVRENEEREGEHGHLGCSSSGSSSGRITESRTNLTKDFWTVEPRMGRVVDGLPNRAHRIKCLGNSVVPLQVRTAFKKLAGMTDGN